MESFLLYLLGKNVIPFSFYGLCYFLSFLFIRQDYFDYFEDSVILIYQQIRLVYVISPWSVGDKIENDDCKQGPDWCPDLLEANLVALLVELRVTEGAIDKQVGEDQENEGDDAGA